MHGHWSVNAPIRVSTSCATPGQHSASLDAAHRINAELSQATQGATIYRAVALQAESSARSRDLRMTAAEVGIFHTDQANLQTVVAALDNQTQLPELRSKDSEALTAQLSDCRPALEAADALASDKNTDGHVQVRSSPHFCLSPKSSMVDYKRFCEWCECASYRHMRHARGALENQPIS